MNYKQRLFEKAIEVEHKMAPAKTEEQSRKLLSTFGDIADEMWANGWREEYDLWAQTIKE